MTSVGGNFTSLSYVKNKIFVDFSFEKLLIFYHRLLGISKDDKIVYSNFFEKLNFFLNLGLT